MPVLTSLSRAKGRGRDKVHVIYVKYIETRKFRVILVKMFNYIIYALLVSLLSCLLQCGASH